jgi:uncharacterized protein YecT (DUF1311 family)
MALLTAVFGTAAVGANAASSTFESLRGNVLVQCGEQSQAGMRECLRKKASESGRLLSTAEQEAALRLSRWDEDEEFVARARKTLQASRTAFAAYRDALCSFDASLGGGAIPNALEMRRLACLYAVNAERVAQLKEMTALLQEK